MTFPNVIATWEYTRVGLSNVIPLTKNGGPYTVSVDKNGGDYTAQVLTSEKLDASTQDDTWELLTVLDSVDVAQTVLGAAVRCVMISITARPAVVGDARIAPCKFTVETANPEGYQQKRRHASGYGGNLFAGQLPLQDPYAALVLADGAKTLFAMQDGALLTLLDSGPDGITDMVGGIGATFSTNGPWPLAAGCIDDAFWNYRSLTLDLGIAPGESGSSELWFNTNAISGNQAPLSGNAGPQVELTSGGEVRVRWQDPTNLAALTSWAASTVYAKGDRHRNVADNNRMYEVEVAGTSGACEPVFPTDLSTVVDNTVTWRDNGNRTTWNDQGSNIPDRLTTGAGVTASVWHHLVISRTPTSFELWFDGVLVDFFDIPAADTFRGSFGTPIQYAYATTDYTSAFGLEYGIVGGSDLFKGRMAYAANYRTSLTAAQVQAHYAKAVALGL